jgi:hypothetical protein
MPRHRDPQAINKWMMANTELPTAGKNGIKIAPYSPPSCRQAAAPERIAPTPRRPRKIFVVADRRLFVAVGHRDPTRLTKPRTNAAISSALVSNAK